MKVKFGILLLVFCGLACRSGLSATEVAKLKPLSSQQIGKRANPLLQTRWAAEVAPTAAHPEYPRPTLVRTDWLNLNGLWEFALTHRDRMNPGAYDGKILVPFPVESGLSGVARPVTEQQRMWYQRKFVVPSQWQGRHVLLHFEAVDWETRVWINGKDVGTHQGGYDRFSFDITDALKTEGEQDLVVSVWDPTNGGTQPRGTQSVANREGFHAACSGIWQTVWLEPVAATSIASLNLVPDIDARVLNMTVLGRGETNHARVEAVALFDGKEVSRAEGPTGQTIKLSISNLKLWSPELPQLYELKVTLSYGGRKVDDVGSYFAMRKISVAKDPRGQPVLMLNNQPLFQFGVLDKGYWPEGVYTAPTDEALRSDIEAIRQLGFNMCRKHLKVEPERWYYWCDKLGLLVWQDMPSGDRLTSYGQYEITRRPQSAQQFELEMERLIEGRRNHPSIVAWVPFHAGWGRYDTARILAKVKELDPSRLVLNTGSASVGVLGDMQSYTSDYKTAGAQGSDPRARILGECRSFPMPVAGHTWTTNVFRNAGQRIPPQFAMEYTNTVRFVRLLAQKHGFSGAVFSQLTDVEDEANGLLTYDRWLKLDPGMIAGASSLLWKPLGAPPKDQDTNRKQ